MSKFTPAFLAIALSVGTSSALAQWQHSWNFDDGNAWQTPVAGQGSYDKSGYGEGLYPRSWNTANQTTTEFVSGAGVGGSGAMRYTGANALGGLRLHLAGNPLADIRNNDFTPAMSAQYTPSASISFHSGGSGIAYFYTFATATPNNNFATGNGFYEAIGIDLANNQVFRNGASSQTATVIPNDWNTISIDMDTTGELSFSLNGTVFSTGNLNNEIYTHMADAWDSAIGIYNFNTVDMQFDNLVIASNIPTPASAALLGFAGLAAARRRR